MSTKQHWTLLRRCRVGFFAICGLATLLLNACATDSYPAGTENPIAVAGTPEAGSPNATGTATDSVTATPTTTSGVAPTATATDEPSPTATEPPSPTAIPTQTATPNPNGGLPPEHQIPPFCSATATPAPGCVACPWRFSQQSYPVADAKAALVAAADAYHLPRALVLGVAQYESGFDPYSVSCSHDIGLMQVKYGLWEGFDRLNVPECGLTPTTDDPYTPQGGANIGARELVYLRCYYGFHKDVAGATQANPVAGTAAWRYAQAQLRFPDTLTLAGVTNPQSQCAATYNATANAYYRAMTATDEQTWSCPIDPAKSGPTLLAIVLSAYNEGIDLTDQQGIQNAWYVQGVEADITKNG